MPIEAAYPRATGTPIAEKFLRKRELLRQHPQLSERIAGIPGTRIPDALAARGDPNPRLKSA